MKICDIIKKIENKSATLFAKMYPNTRQTTLVLVGVLTNLALLAILLEIVFVLFWLITGFGILNLWIIFGLSLSIFLLWHQYQENKK